MVRVYSILEVFRIRKYFFRIRIREDNKLHPTLPFCGH